MNIKNIKVFKNPKLKVKLCALALAGVVAITALSGCSTSENTQYEQSYVQESKKVFESGEHIISVPVENPTKDTIQYDYYEGYKCVGLATSFYGQYGSSFGGACALYVNEYPVECYASGVDKNNMFVYSDFGTPLDYEKTDNNTTSETKDFGVGEHIISVPIGDPRNINAQYQCYDGYEPVDLAFGAYGKYGNSYSGGAIMYVNTVPVRCTVTKYDENNKGYYLSFGSPIELEKTLTK